MRKAYSYIRMSTEQQLKGDSLRRQKALSAEYATKQGWELVDSIEGENLSDLGVSAFRSKNTHEGALGRFISAIAKGLVESGSVLLVESLDRLSRDNTLKAFNQFSTILQSGIEIVTLSDQRHYTEKTVSNNFAELFISLGIMFRSNEESETKSKRISASWENKRKNAATKPITRCCPAWLQYNETSSKFVSIEDRASIVNTIFDMCISTCGLYGIARYLNTNKVPVFGRGQLWHRSYIKKIISNRSVLGEFQAKTTIDSVKVEAGDVICNYYPAIVEEDKFLLANDAIRQRSSTGKGRKGVKFSNLFTGLIYCGSCGHKMTLLNRGKPPKGGKYLCCTNQHVHAGCKMTEWKLDKFESTLFKHLKELDFSSLVNKEPKPINLLESKRAALISKLNVIEGKVNRIVDTMTNDDLNIDSKLRFRTTLNELELNVAAQKKLIKELEYTIQLEKTKLNVFDSSEVVKLLDLLKVNQDDYFLRSSVHQLLRKYITKITLIQEPVKFSYEYENTDSAVISFRQTHEGYKESSIDSFVDKPIFEKYATQHMRHITIKYSSGASRQIVYGRDRSHLRNFPLIGIY